MTTTTSNPQTMYGTGAPVAIAPNGTRYFDTSNGQSFVEYICFSGVWYPVGGANLAQLVLTSAQILALHTTPQNLIPAPAANQLILIGTVTYKGTGAYTNAGGSGLVYHGLTLAADNSFALPANPWINGITVSGGIDAIASGANKSMGTALGLGVDVSGVAADPTVGTTPATVTATYRIITP